MVEAKRKFRLINYEARQVSVVEFPEFHRAGVPSPAAGMQRPEIHLGRLAPVQQYGRNRGCCGSQCSRAACRMPAELPGEAAIREPSTGRRPIA